MERSGMAWGKEACTHKEERTLIIRMGESGSQTCFDTYRRGGVRTPGPYPPAQDSALGHNAAATRGLTSLSTPILTVAVT